MFSELARTLLSLFRTNAAQHALSSNRSHAEPEPMTAGFFIANPSPAGPAGVVNGLPGALHGIAGPGAATGFEALLAAFFGNQAAGTATAQAALLSGKPGLVKAGVGAPDPAKGANDNSDDDAKTTDGAVADKGQTISAEAQALAALMATPLTPSAAQAGVTVAADTAKTGASAATAATFASQKLFSQVGGKDQTAAEPAASALAAAADAATLAKDQAVAPDPKAGLAKPGAPVVPANGPTSGATGTAAAPKAAEPVAAPYAPPVAARTEVAAATPPVPLPADATAPAESAADLAAVEAAATAPQAAAPIKPKDLPASHATDRSDNTHRTTADPPAIDGAAATSAIRHPVTQVAPVAARTGDQPDAGARAEIADTKLAKTDETGAASQATAAAPADHTAQAGPTAAAARATPETVASLAAQILKKADGRTTRFDVELHPADLGRVDVRLEIGAQGRMTAAMSFENPQAAAELRGRAHELQRALEQAGFDVSGGLSFDVAGDRGQGGQNLAGQQQQPDGGGASRGRAFQAALQSAGDTTAAAISGAVYGQGRTTSGVDIRI